MTDRLTDEYSLEEIYEFAEIKYFYDDYRRLLESVIEELYHSNKSLLSKLRLKHIDRAIFKFRQAKEKTCIYDSKQYFKACVVSAIREVSLDELEPYA